VAGLVSEVTLQPYAPSTDVFTVIYDNGYNYTYSVAYILLIATAPLTTSYFDVINNLTTSRRYHIQDIIAQFSTLLPELQLQLGKVLLFRPPSQWMAPITIKSFLLSSQ